MPKSTNNEAEQRRTKLEIINALVRQWNMSKTAFPAFSEAKMVSGMLHGPHDPKTLTGLVCSFSNYKNQDLIFGEEFHYCKSLDGGQVGRDANALIDTIVGKSKKVKLYMKQYAGQKIVPFAWVRCTKKEPTGHYTLVLTKEDAFVAGPTEWKEKPTTHSSYSEYLKYMRKEHDMRICEDCGNTQNVGSYGVREPEYQMCDQCGEE